MKHRFSTLIWPLGLKWKFWNLIAHLQDIHNYILEYHLSTLWNVHSSSDNNEKKWKFQNLIAHLQNMPNQILEYHLAMTLESAGITTPI